MKKTGINYLKFALDKDNKCPMLFETAEMFQMEIMDEFSQWLANNEWELNQASGIWEKVDNLYHSMSELYQMFLKTKNK